MHCAEQEPHGGSGRAGAVQPTWSWRVYSAACMSSAAFSMFSTPSSFCSSTYLQWQQGDMRFCHKTLAQYYGAGAISHGHSNTRGMQEAHAHIFQQARRGQPIAPLVDLVAPTLLCGDVALAGTGPTAAPAPLAAGPVTVLSIIWLLATLTHGPVKQR